MDCKNCIYLSRDGSHLENEYLKEAVQTSEGFYTCKYPHEFRATWVFIPVNGSPCGGKDFKSKFEQLKIEI